MTYSNDGAAGRDRLRGIPSELQEKPCGVMVSTPLQYLNALELVEKLGCRERYLVICRHFDRGDFADLPGFGRWTRVDSLHSRRLFNDAALRGGLRWTLDVISDIRAKRKIAEVLAGWPGLELMMIGNQHEVLHQAFIAQGQGKEALICEDGTSNVLLAPLTMPMGKRLRRRLLGIPERLLGHAWHFSAYSDTRMERRILHNDYAHLRSLLIERSVGAEGSGEIWFLGQPLVEFGVTSPGVYAEVLRGICQEVYSDRSVCYLPHPRERGRHLEELAAVTGMEIAARHGPVELELIRHKAPPSRVAMLYSSAYQSCHSIFRGAVAFDIFEPREDLWREGHSEVRIMRECYGYFRRHVQRPHRIFCQGPANEWRRVESAETQGMTAKMAASFVHSAQAMPGGEA